MSNIELIFSPNNIRTYSNVTNAQLNKNTRSVEFTDKDNHEVIITFGMNDTIIMGD